MTIMKKIAFFICAIAFSLGAYGQKFDIKRVEPAPFDLTASTQPRLCLTNKPCAVVKFEIPSPNAKFQGNVIGDVSYEAGEYVVYVSPDTKQLKVLHEGVLPALIYFPDYGIDCLEGKRTYYVTLTLPEVNGEIHDDIKEFPNLYIFRDTTTSYFGLKNEDDETVVDAEYEIIEDFKDDGYFTSVKNNKVGMLDLQGKPLLPCIYDMPIDIGKNHILCSLKGKWGIVDFQNKEMLPHIYDDMRNVRGEYKSSIFIIKKDGKYALGDTVAYKPVTDFIFEDIKPGNILYDNGTVRIYNPASSRLLAAKKDGKWGFIDGHGEWKIKPQYEDDNFLGNPVFTNGTAAVQNKDGYFGIIDETGKTVVPFEYRRIFIQMNDDPNMYYFAEGSAGYEVYTTKGKKITHQPYYSLEACNDGTCTFTAPNGKQGVFNLEDGTEIASAIYDEVQYLNSAEGRIMVRMGDKWGCIDHSGKEIFGFNYEQVKGYANGVCPVKYEGKWGMLNSNGSLLVPYKYDAITKMGSDRLAGIWENKSGNYALVNYLGKEVTPFQYTNVEFFDSVGDFSARRVEKYIDSEYLYGYVDFKGKEIIPCKYPKDEALVQLEKYAREKGLY